MSIDYNLVIIGATNEGIHAALKAVNLKMRVALVQQPLMGHLEADEVIFRTGYSRITHLYQLLNQWHDSDINPQCDRLRLWLQSVDTTIKAENSLAMLAAKSIDVIEESGEFVRLPHLGFAVSGRKLQATSYLIATGSRPCIPQILGLEDVSYLISSAIWKIENLAILPQHLTIIGATPSALQLAQLLRRFGKKITLIVANNYLLPNEDREISRFLQALLESEGIEIFTQQSVTQVKAIDGKKWLQLGNHVIETDEIIFADDYQSNHEGLNLEGAGVQLEKDHILVNPKLQTTNAKIYACGTLQNGYPDPSVDRQEAEIAVKNALSRFKLSINYSDIPQVIFCDPPFARIGLTEHQAKQLYGEKIKVLKYYFKNNVALQITGDTMGFCQLIIKNNGKILGAHLIGSRVEEIISLISLAMKENLKIQSIANSLYPFLTVSEIIGEITSQVPQKKSFLHWFKMWLKR